MSSSVELRPPPPSASPPATTASSAASMSAASPSLSQQQYCLRWNNHQHNLLSVFENLLRSEAFVDVTLACDGVQLKAHKMVLSACSPYFQAMLHNTPDRHPIVFLRDVRYEEMKALLEFMYRGEVSVDQENLNSLLKVAEGLKIKGLAEVGDNNSPAAAAAKATPTVEGTAILRHHALLSSHHAMEALAASASASSPLKRMSSPVPQHHHPLPPVTSNGGVSLPAPQPPSSTSTSTSSANLGPKRKRARPRRLSGCEAVPMAGRSSSSDREILSRQQQQQRMDQPLEVQTEDINMDTKLEKVSRATFVNRRNIFGERTRCDRFFGLRLLNKLAKEPLFVV